MSMSSHYYSICNGEITAVFSGSTYKTVRLNRLAALLGASEKDALEGEI